MFTVNGEKLTPTSFPDKTCSLRLYARDDAYKIEWKYDGDHECMLLWNLVHHIRANNGENTPIGLYMPYVPNARMDRVKNCDEVFTLKWFAEFINSLHFSYVQVFDPHSNVSEALINHVEPIAAHDCIESVIDELNGKRNMNVLLCYPDEGASKRYSAMFQMDYVFCIKHRDWRTGKIERLELTDPEKVAWRNVLIVDDICSRGGTFIHTAKALRGAGAKEIFLYVSHCEDTILQGDVLKDGIISHVFTTSSILRASHEKISIIY